MSPSIDTLGAVLDALGTTLPGFFSDLQSSLPYTPFYSSADLIEIGKADTISYRVIGLDHPNRQMLMLHERYAIGADSERNSPMRHRRPAWCCPERSR